MGGGGIAAAVAGGYRGRGGGGPSASHASGGRFDGRGGGGGGAFGGMDSGAGAHRASARGQESRGSFGGRPEAAGSQSRGGAPAGGGGGGAHAASRGGGGGARAAVAAAAAGGAAVAAVAAAAAADEGDSMKRMQIQRLTGVLLGCILYAAALPALLRPGAQRTFDSPEAAAKALVAAAAADDEAALVDIFGAKYRDVVVHADKAQDRENRARFAQAAEQYQLLRAEKDGRVTLLVGPDAWPLPIPLVQTAGAWRFDTAAGAEEIDQSPHRRERARGDRGAQRSTAMRSASTLSKPRDKHERAPVRAAPRAAHPARKTACTWDADASKGEELSPLGPLISDAAARKGGEPYHGYYYKILKGQGPAAPGGRYSYVINGRMVAGYALIAYPAAIPRSPASRLSSSITTATSTRKTSGRRPHRSRQSISDYNPDKTWSAGCGLTMRFARVVVLCIAGLGAAPIHAGEALNAIKSRGVLRCGVSEGIAGFSAKDASGRWVGMDADFCRAVAAAALGNAEKVEFVPLTASARFPALQGGRIDLLVRQTTWTLGREIGSEGAVRGHPALRRAGVHGAEEECAQDASRR